MTTTKSKLGYHCGPGGNKNGLGSWEQQLNVFGVPFFLKSVDEYGVLNEAVNFGNQYGVNNLLIYRQTAAVTGFREIPRYEVDPLIDAVSFVNGYIQFLPPEYNKEKVFLELINEPRTKNNPGDIMYNNMNAVDYLGVWSKKAAEYANSLGYKVALPSFNSGEPPENDYEQPGWLDFLYYAAANPQKCIVSIHEYAFGWKLDTYPHLFGRFERIIAAADIKNIPRTFNIAVTEWGGNYNDSPSWPDIKVFLDHYNNIIAKFPQVVGFAAWTLQAGWGNISNSVQTWIQPSIDYNKTEQFDMGQQPHPTFSGTLPGTQWPPKDDCRGGPRIQYKRKVYLLNPLQDSSWAKAIHDALVSERVTVSFSIDDAMIGDLDDREVIVINGDDWNEFLFK